MRLKLNIIVKCSVFFSLLLLMTACSTPKTRVVLLPVEDSDSKGAVVVGEGSTATVLDEPMTAAEVGSSGRVKTREVTQEEVEKDFSAALAATPPKPISFTLYFKTGTTTIMDVSKAELEELFAEVASRKAVEVQITGHTDTAGTLANNDKLSTQRAEVIKEMLISEGLQSNFIRAVGRGERELLIQTPDNVHEGKNRRVEVIVR